MMPKEVPMGDPSVAPGLLDSRRAGLLVIDIQTKLFPFIDNHSQVLRRTKQLIEIAGHLELPIMVTEQYTRGLGPTLPELIEIHTRFAEFDPLEKRAFSCFGDAPFCEEFDQRGIDTLAIAGIETHICVMQTALDALERGLTVFLVAEATGSRLLSHKIEALDRLHEAGAIIGSAEMFAFEMMRTSNHPKFKQVQRVIM